MEFRIRKLDDKTHAAATLAAARTKTRGGARKGAGRKPRPEKTKLTPIHLTDWERSRAEWLGEGNMTLGISRALLTCPDWARKVE